MPSSSGTPPLLQSVLSGPTDSARASWPLAARDLQILRTAKYQRRTVKKNAGASLVASGTACSPWSSIRR